MSTRRSIRCRKNGLGVFFLANDTTTTPVPQAASFGAALGPLGGYSVAFATPLLYFLERSWLDLPVNDFTLVL